MHSDWERRLAERTIAVGVACGELVEVIDPFTHETYYAPASEYPSVPRRDRSATSGGRGERRAAPRKLNRLRARVAASVIAGILAVPSLDAVPSTRQTSRSSALPGPTGESEATLPLRKRDEGHGVPRRESVPASPRLFWGEDGSAFVPRKVAVWVS